MEAGKVAELEAAQAAAQAALLAEMDLLRRQKAAAEEQARRLETQVRQGANTRLARLLSGRHDCSISWLFLSWWQFFRWLIACGNMLQLGELASALRASREEVAAQVAAATAKDRENSQLWEQVSIFFWRAGGYLRVSAPMAGSTLH